MDPEPKTEPMPAPIQEVSVASMLADEPTAPEEPLPKKVKVEEPEQQIPNHTEPPVHEMVGGSSVRRYLNQHLTQHLLEGLKRVSANKPADPLRELGEFLIQRSKELEKEN